MQQCRGAAETNLGNLIGIYGWRKRCLYILLMGLMLVVVGNLVATILLLNATHFNLSGLGDLSVSSSGVQVGKYSRVLDSLVASRLSSRQRQPLSIESYYNMTMVLRNDDGYSLQFLHFWNSLQEPNSHEAAASASQFQVNDLRGRALFTAQKGEIAVGADILKILDGGVQFTGSVQTSMLRSSLGSELMLESATRRLYLTAPQKVSIESRAADISASCLTDLKLSSTDGKVKMKAPGIYIPSLETMELMKSPTSRYYHQELRSASSGYQLCICTNGKLFVARSTSECGVDSDNSQCR